MSVGANIDGFVIRSKKNFHTDNAKFCIAEWVSTVYLISMSVHEFKPRKPKNKPPREPMFNIEDPAPFVLAAILVLCYLGFVLAGTSFQDFAREAGSLFASEGRVLFSQRPLGSISTLVTHVLLHADWSHVLINAVFICIFGILTIRGVKNKHKSIFGFLRRGPVVFLAVFIIGAIGGGLLQWLYWGVFSLTGVAVGASTGGSALFATAAWAIGGRDRLMTFGLFVVGFDVINLLMGGNVAWAAHLGGYLTGAALAILWVNPNSADMRSFR
ncbi:MAG: hypothetical protein COA43_15440 [Robiginitomaculum sp.]|nr:MAG: hypothetical protein COA43_15440 [Robiginitomaculum sp.]